MTLDIILFIICLNLLFTTFLTIVQIPNRLDSISNKQQIMYDRLKRLEDKGGK